MARCGTFRPFSAALLRLLLAAAAPFPLRGVGEFVRVGLPLLPFPLCVRRLAARAAVALPPGPRRPALGDAAPAANGDAAPRSFVLPRAGEDAGVLVCLLVRRRFAGVLRCFGVDLDGVLEDEEADTDAEAEGVRLALLHAVRPLPCRGVVAAAFGSLFSSAPSFPFEARMRVTVIACEAVRSASSAISSSKNWKACIIVCCLLFAS